MLSHPSARASLRIAPLALPASHAVSVSDATFHQNQHTGFSKLGRHSQMTPPETPHDFQGEESPESLPETLPPPIFHNFLRAFYPFHPSDAMSDSSVTLPLDEGDVVLIHSIHTNGWADGTLLATGDRGWLPTNYCEAYEPDDMRALLKALLNFWDLLRSTSVKDTEIFGSQEFMKGIIAGVRYLLERTNCLSRESTVIQRSEPLRKCRKSLLSDLSSLVKSAKRLQECQRGALVSVDEVTNLVDEMILKGFSIVNKGVRFEDVLEEDRRTRAPASVTVMATVAEESLIPPTPPADRELCAESSRDFASDSGSRAGDNAAMSSTTSELMAESASSFPPLWNKRVSSLNYSAPRRFSHGSSNGNRLSSGISHRVSLAGPSPLSQPQNLISDRLNKSHDRFLSHLGSFIGRLHLQSQSRPELSLAIKQSASSGGALLAVVDAIAAQNYPSSDALSQYRAAVYEHILDLVYSARDTLASAATEEADIIMPHDNSILLMSATGCVRAAGECVAKAKAAIERLGDFEFETGDAGMMGIDLNMLDVAEDCLQKPSMSDMHDTVSIAGSSRTSNSSTPAPRMTPAAILQKPLPEAPREVASAEQQTPLPPSRLSIRSEDTSSQRCSPTPSIRPSLPPLPKLSTAATAVHQRRGQSQVAHDAEMQSSHFDSLVASSAGSSATYLSRDSEASIASQTSTRATTPDHYLAPRNQPSMSDLSAAGSSTHTEEVDDVEHRLLERTYANELMFNKEGQVTGGSLPALVERLTTHDSTPDPVFVSAFYLTFRLFCTPVKLAGSLIERFEYVGESPHIAGPVRLRVYNAFKGWLESHWRDSTDREALKLIIPFAEGRLSKVLPSAGDRILDLARRVGKEGLLVPRLISSMGKTNMFIGSYVPADLPMPQPAISKSQQNLLASFKRGGSSPSILDFEPLEIARQLTLKQMSVFCSILPDELLGSRWMKNGGVEAPNVKAMSSLTTDISNFVAETILQYAEIKKRAQAIKHWIKIANQCHELHNYDGLMAIICSLNSSTINRLRKTWDVVSTKRKEMLRTLQKIVEPSQNNKVLRARLHDHVPPCLPFLGMYLTDLTFTDIGNPPTKQMLLGHGDGHGQTGGLTVVNFDKHSLTAKIIGDLQRFQIPYRLTELPDLQDWLSAQINSVREGGDQGNVQVSYYRKSLLLEPRETASRAAPEVTPNPHAGGTGSSRTDLFAWMTRDRSAHASTPTQV